MCNACCSLIFNWGGEFWCIGRCTSVMWCVCKVFEVSLTSDYCACTTERERVVSQRCVCFCLCEQVITNVHAKSFYTRNCVPLKHVDRWHLVILEGNWMMMTTTGRYTVYTQHKVLVSSPFTHLHAHTVLWLSSVTKPLVLLICHSFRNLICVFIIDQNYCSSCAL